MIIGYARVSTLEQNTASQFDAFAKAGITDVREEKKSAVKKRPVLEAVLAEMGPGDELVVYKLDRLARSLSHLLTIFETLEQRGATIRSLTEPVDSKSPVGRLFVHMMGSFAEFERALIRERCVGGQIAARARGQVWGRPPTLGPHDAALAVELYRSTMDHPRATRTWTIDKIATHLGVTRGAVRSPLCKAGLLSSIYLR